MARQSVIPLAMTPTTTTASGGVMTSDPVTVDQDVRAVIFRIFDSVGSETASAVDVEAISEDGGTTWINNANYCGIKHDGGNVANAFLGAVGGGGAVLVVPAVASTPVPGIPFKVKQLRLKITRAINASGNALTPTVRAIVIRDNPK